MKSKTLEKIKPLIDEVVIISEDLMDENLYNSGYESYAILKEEIEAISTYSERIEKALDKLWLNTKNCSSTDINLRQIKSLSYFMLVEAIELISIADKAMKSKQ